VSDPGSVADRFSVYAAPSATVPSPPIVTVGATFVMATGPWPIRKRATQKFKSTLSVP
jgi:hypothetical protein